MTMAGTGDRKRTHIQHEKLIPYDIGCICKRKRDGFYRKLIQMNTTDQATAQESFTGARNTHFFATSVKRSTFNLLALLPFSIVFVKRNYRFTGNHLYRIHKLILG